MKLEFPKDFFWGAATASYQVEGGIENNDWARAAREGKVPPAGDACEQYSRYSEDFDIAKSLGHNAHRFSIEWSRIEPQEGVFDEEAITHYREVIKDLRKKGMEPFVTIWHWTLPEWFEEKGGWLHPEATDTFLVYTRRIVEEYKDIVTFWIVCNEPETPVRSGYVLGERPPGQKFRIFSAYRALKKVIKTYVAVYKLIKDLAPESQVGFSESLVFFEPYNKLPHNLILTRFLKWWRNNPFFGTFAQNSDFIGLQYYFHSRIRLNPWKSKWWIQCNENRRVSDFGWEIYPEGIYRMLLKLKKYSKPIYVTENGLADANDIYRADFIREHLQYCHKAIHEGVDLRGYFHWSLLDNYEWVEGYKMRFGLVEVDFKTQERKPRPSAQVYKKICESNMLEL